MGLLNSQYNGLPVINSSNMNVLKQAYELCRNSANPTAMLQQMARNNPSIAMALNTALNMCNGQDYQQVFYNLCKQKGTDPQSILSQFR